jgi:hypothetical protein
VLVRPIPNIAFIIEGSMNSGEILVDALTGAVVKQSPLMPHLPPLK